MTRTRRLLAGAAALTTLTVLATGCDSSPFAASVNGQVVKQTALNSELRQLAGNTGYVKLVAGGRFGRKAVTVSGVSSGTYNSTWTASVLTSVVIGTAVHQGLARAHRLPGPAQLIATRSVDNLLYQPETWDAFSPAFRTSLVERDADLAMQEPDAVGEASLRSTLAGAGAELFSLVCVRSVDVDVSAAGGAVDYPASLARARALSAGFGSPSSSAGAVSCYGPAQIETQPIAFVTTILQLKTGAAATPTRTGDGYQVLAVTTRTELPIGNALGRAITVADNEFSGATAQAVAPVLARSKVKVNPLYGSWAGGPRTAYGVVAPVQPGLTPAAALPG